MEVDHSIEVKQDEKVVVEPTHLKNMIVKMSSSSPNFGLKIPKIFEAQKSFKDIKF